MSKLICILSMVAALIPFRLEPSRYPRPGRARSSSS